MLYVLLSLAAASTLALRYGGNSGGYHLVECQSGNYVEKIRVHRGNFLDGLSIKCTNENWSEWKGGYGGGYASFYPDGSGFCGMWGRHGAFIDRLCLQSVDGDSKCFGGPNGGPFSDQGCSDSPGNSRARLSGFHVRSGAFIDGLTPIWKKNIDCPPYLQIANSPMEAVNGYYSFHTFHNGHHMYKHNTREVCIYYSHKAWRIHQGCNTNHWHIKFDTASTYNICPSGLSGRSGWYHQGQGYIYPDLQLQELYTLPLQWGNIVGYWAYVSSGSGSSGGAIRTWTTSFTDTSSTSQTYSTTEEQAFSKTQSESNTWGFEIGVKTELDFNIGMSAERKYSYAHSLTHSATQTTTHATSSALTTASSTSNTESEGCQSEAPTFGGRWGVGSTPWYLYVWEVYRASSVENVGATQRTCEFQYQTGPCRFIPPNCPLGTCLDEHCIQCIAGVDPFKSLSDLQNEYPGCLDSLGIEADAPRCSLQTYDWSCCSATEPCGLHEGDCDSDSDCAGELVCDKSFCMGNTACPHSSFDVCNWPDRRELSQGDEPMKDEDPEGNSIDNRLSGQINRLLEGDERESSMHKDLAAPPMGKLNSEDVYPEEKWEREPISGCIQFDDEGHCTTGPLYKYCRWQDKQCINKENVNDEEVPKGDFTYVYGSSESEFTLLN